MTKRGRPRKRYPSLDELPKELRLAMAKVMVQFNIADIGKAYNMAALLLDANSKKFQKEVEKEAERRYRSRFMKAINKTRSTIEKNARKWAYTVSLRDAKLKYRIWGFCVRCGREFDILPNSDAHKEIIKCLREKQWRHIECPQ